MSISGWIDRPTGIRGIYGSQVFPGGDPACLITLFAEFERESYEAHRAVSKA